MKSNDIDAVSMVQFYCTRPTHTSTHWDSVM